MKTTLIRIAVWALAFLLLPNLALAAKSSNQVITTQKPIKVDPVPVFINKVPTTKVVRPKVDIHQTKPSSVRLPDGVRANAVQKPASPKFTPATKTPIGVGQLPAQATLGNANTLQEANQARGLGGAKDAAEAARNVVGLPERPDGINPDLGLGGSKGPDLSKLPGHDAGIGFEDPTGRLPVLPNNQDKGHTGGAPIGALSPKQAMQGAASQRGGSRTRFPTYIDPPGPGRRGGGGPWLTDDRNDEYGVSPGGNSTGAIMTLHFRSRNGRGTRAEELGRNGVVGWSEKWLDSNGNIDQRSSSVNGHTVDIYYNSGNASKFVDGVEVPDRPQGGIDKSQDPDSADTDGAWARWWAKLSGQRPDLGLKNPNKVNPGPDGAMPEPQAPRLQLPEDQLVVNPDPNNPVSVDGVINEETAANLRRTLPTNPGGGDDDRRGDR